MAGKEVTYVQVRLAIRNYSEAAELGKFIQGKECDVRFVHKKAVVSKAKTTAQEKIKTACNRLGSESIPLTIYCRSLARWRGFRHSTIRGLVTMMLVLGNARYDVINGVEHICRRI